MLEKLNEILTIKNVTSEFYNFEKELNLLNIQIQEVFFWKIIRFSTWMHIVNHYGLYGQAHLSLNHTPIQRKISNLKKIYNTEVNSYISRKKPVDILVFEHPRKVQIDGKYTDIYTNSKVEEIKRNNFSYEIVDSPYLDKHYDKPNKFRSYSEDFGFKYKRYRNKYVFNLTNEEKNLIYYIENKFFDVFKINIKLENLILSTIRGFTLRKKIIKESLKKRKVKKVYLVVSYGHEVLIAACKELNIETIEIQHGNMSYYHVGYSFPYNTTIPYFPDRIEMFSEYWRDSTPLPIDKNHIKFIGYPYLEKQIKAYENLGKIKNTVVILSQGTIGKKLADYALEFAKQNPELIIYYKLHPGEFGRWRNSYKNLLAAEELENFKIIEKEINLYELLAISELAIGVYSTSLYEALACNCKVIVINLPGVEYCEYLYSNNIVRLVEQNQYKINSFKINELKEIVQNYFFKKVKIQND